MLCFVWLNTKNLYQILMLFLRFVISLIICCSLYDTDFYSWSIFLNERDPVALMWSTVVLCAVLYWLFRVIIKMYGTVNILFLKLVTLYCWYLLQIETHYMFFLIQYHRGLKIISLPMLLFWLCIFAFPSITNSILKM